MKQAPLPVFTDWFQKIKTFCLFPELIGLLPQLQLCCIGASCEAFAGSAVASMICGLDTGSYVGVDPFQSPGRCDYLQYLV